MFSSKDGQSCCQARYACGYMARKNRTQFSILGFLASESGTGYDIRTWLEGISSMWHESYGQIYPTLARLTEEGLVTRSVAEGATGSDKYIYSITDEGRQALTEWLNEPVYFAPPRSELLLRVYFAKHADKEILIAQILRYREAAQATYEWCLELEQTYVTDKTPLASSDHAFMTISHGLYVTRAQMAWCDDMLERLNHKVD